jgi:hypothetical protein
VVDQPPVKTYRLNFLDGSWRTLQSLGFHEDGAFIVFEGRADYRVVTSNLIAIEELVEEEPRQTAHLGELFRAQ